MCLDTSTQPSNTTDASSTASGTPAGGRVQLALNVRDVDAAVESYGKLFGVQPAKRRPGYANFTIASPPLELVLIEDLDARSDGVTGALNHLGVEVASSLEVGAATQRLTGQGLATLTQDATSCCYAVQDKVWVHDPDGAPWEVYTVLADAPDDTSIAGGTSCTTVDGQCVPSGAVGDVELTTHGVPVAAAAAAPDTAEACCDTTTAKSSCCKDATAGQPSSCDCS